MNDLCTLAITGSEYLLWSFLGILVFSLVFLHWPLSVFSGESHHSDSDKTYQGMGGTLRGTGVISRAQSVKKGPSVQSHPPDFDGSLFRVCL